MKKLAIALCLTYVSYASAQKISADKVPANVTNSFVKQFPKAEKSKWELEENNYEVNFHLGKIEYSAKYNPNAQWLETEQEISLAEIPATIKQAIDKEFGKVETEEAEKVSLSNNVTVYEMEIEQNKKQKFEVQFSVDGKLLKKEELRKKESKD